MVRLLPIGQFARACRLSVKALRHYDELGLLRPARIDASGYRYYARTQARDAIAISLLRSLDVPLSSVRDVLASTREADTSALLQQQRERIERQIARSRRALACVDRMIRNGAVLRYAVEVAEAPAQTWIAVEERALPEDHVEVGYALVQRLRDVMCRLGLEPRGSFSCHLPESEDDDSMTLQMGCSVAVATDSAAVAAAGALLLHAPASTLATTEHRGAYEEIGVAHHALLAWAEENGRPSVGPMRETYLNDPAHVPEAELLTRISLPISMP